MNLGVAASTPAKEHTHKFFLNRTTHERDNTPREKVDAFGCYDEENEYM